MLKYAGNDFEIYDLRAISQYYIEMKGKVTGVENIWQTPLVLGTESEEEIDSPKVILSFIYSLAR